MKTGDTANIVIAFLAAILGSMVVNMAEDRKELRELKIELASLKATCVEVKK